MDGTFIEFTPLQWTGLALLLLAYLALSTVCAAWTGAGWRIRQRQLRETLAAERPALARMVVECYRGQRSLRLARQLKEQALLLGLI